MLNIKSTYVSNAHISQSAQGLLNSGMDIKEIRLKNLRLLINDAGSAAELARRAKTDPAYLSQILSTKIKRALGDELARRIERAMTKPHGWMDHLNTAEEPGRYKIETGLSKQAMDLASTWDKLPPNAKETVLSCLRWTIEMEKRKEKDSMALLRQVLKNVMK